MSPAKRQVRHLRALVVLPMLLSILGAAPDFAQFSEPMADLVADLETAGEPLLIPGPIMGSFFEVWGSAPSQLFGLGEERYGGATAARRARPDSGI